MALDHSRFGVENKSGRIFSVRQVYFTNSCQQIWVRANLVCTQNLQIFFHGSPDFPLSGVGRSETNLLYIFIHHFWGERVLWGVVFIIQTTYKMQYFTIFQDKLHSFNIQDHRNTLELLAKPFKKFPKSPIRPAGSNFRQALNLQRNLKYLGFNMIKNLLCLFIC